MASSIKQSFVLICAQSVAGGTRCTHVAVSSFVHQPPFIWQLSKVQSNNEFYSFCCHFSLIRESFSPVRLFLVSFYTQSVSLQRSFSSWSFYLRPFISLCTDSLVRTRQRGIISTRGHLRGIIGLWHVAKLLLAPIVFLATDFRCTTHRGVGRWGSIDKNLDTIIAARS